MEIYRYFPDIEHSLANSTLKSINKQNKAKEHSEIGIRIDAIKLGILTAVDAAVHTLTALGKTGAAIVQLPLYPLWEGTAPDLAFVEAGGHAARAIKLVIAAVVVPVPSMVRPGFVMSSYKWLALDEAPKDSLFAKTAQRTKHLMSHIFTQQNLHRAMIAVALLITGLVGYQYLTPLPLPTEIKPDLLPTVEVIQESRWPLATILGLSGLGLIGFGVALAGVCQRPKQACFSWFQPSSKTPKAEEAKTEEKKAPQPTADEPEKTGGPDPVPESDAKENDLTPPVSDEEEGDEGEEGVD